MKIGSEKKIYLVAPGARYTGVLLHASSQFNVLVSGVQMSEAILDVGHDSSQRLPGQNNAWPAHAKVLVVLQREEAELLRVSSSRLADVHRPVGIDGS